MIIISDKKNNLTLLQLFVGFVSYVFILLCFVFVVIFILFWVMFGFFKKIISCN